MLWTDEVYRQPIGNKEEALVNVYKRMIIVLSLLAVVGGAGLFSRGASADALPSGERVFGQVAIEPAYNDINGDLVYLLTPMHAPFHANEHAVSPLYIVMYPTSASDVGTMNCAHQPADNCPDHGPELAGLAMATVPEVYGGGVWGHDHLGDMPPAPKSKGGGEFNVAWEPVVVLFTNAEAANTHVTTDAQIDALVDSGDAIEIPLPEATFLCAVVSGRTYQRATPVEPVSDAS